MSGSGSDDKRPSRVLDHLFIGSRVHAKNRGLLKELGINRILNVTPARTMDPTNGVPNFFEKDRSMTYKRVAVFDNRGEDLLQHLESCISFIEQGSFYGKVLVHCNKGVSRSSTVVAAYLMRTRGLSKTAAMTYLRSRRSIVNPHEGFMAQLEAFDVKLNVEREAAIADGQEKKFPDDLLGRRAPQGPAIGPIGPPRGPAAPPTSPPRAPRSTSPMRRPASGPSPPRTTGAKKGPAGKARAASNSPPRVRAGPIGPSRGPEPAPRPIAPPAAAAAAAGDSAGAAVGPRPRPAGGPEESMGAGSAASRKALATQSGDETAANGSALKTPPPAEAGVKAPIGPAVGPPLRPDVPVSEGGASTGGGGGDDAHGAGVAERDDARAGDSLGCSVGDKRAREEETAADLAEAVVRKPRVAVSGEGGKG